MLNPQERMVKTSAFRFSNLSVLFEDAHIIVINKPAGLLSIPDRADQETALKTILDAHFGKIWTVHRLDKLTSGVILFAKSAESHSYYTQLFEHRKMEKRYIGFVHGLLPKPEDTIDVALTPHPHKAEMLVTQKKGKPSQTHYKLIESFMPYSFVEFTIATGRLHQIRAHMKHVGNPILCDTVYGDGAPVLLSSIKKKYNLSLNQPYELPLLNRLALHAASLACTHIDHSEKIFSAPMPKDLQAFLQQLRKLKSKKS